MVESQATHKCLVGALAVKRTRPNSINARLQVVGRDQIAEGHQLTGQQNKSGGNDVEQRTGSSLPVRSCATLGRVRARGLSDIDCCSWQPRTGALAKHSQLTTQGDNTRRQFVSCSIGKYRKRRLLGVESVKCTRGSYRHWRSRRRRGSLLLLEVVIGGGGASL